MPEKLSHEADPKHVPDVVYVSPMELKPKRVGIGLLVGAIVLTIGIGSAYFITNFVLTDATPAPSVEIKKATSSAKPATTSAQKKAKENSCSKETNPSYPLKTKDWVLFEDKIHNVSLRRPKGWFTDPSNKKEGTTYLTNYDFVNAEPGDYNPVKDRGKFKIDIGVGPKPVDDLETSVKDTSNFSPPEQLVSMENLEVDGCPAVKAEYTTIINKTTTLVLVDRGNVRYSIGGFLDYESNKDIFDLIVSTIRFLD